MHSTPANLLDRLCHNPDVDAWARFVRLYTPLLFAWSRGTGLGEADTADLVQDVFTVLIEQLPTFRYDPNRSFCGWLRTILINRWRAQKRPRLPVPVDQLDHVPDDAEPPWPDETDERRQLLRCGLTLVKAEVTPATWEAFHRNVLVARPAAQVAGELKITVNSVYIAKSRVLQRLRQLVAGMME